jgi:hypothetical protein
MGRRELARERALKRCDGGRREFNPLTAGEFPANKTPPWNRILRRGAVWPRDKII